MQLTVACVPFLYKHFTCYPSYKYNKGEERLTHHACNVYSTLHPRMFLPALYMLLSGAHSCTYLNREPFLEELLTFLNYYMSHTILLHAVVPFLCRLRRNVLTHKCRLQISGIPIPDLGQLSTHNRHTATCCNNMAFLLYRCKVRDICIPEIQVACSA